MIRPSELPPILRLEPFSVAEALELGVSPDRLRARDLQRPFHGTRAVGLDLSSLYHLCRAYAPRLRPGDVFSHETAARLWGLPLPLYARRDVFVSASSPRRAPRARGIIGSQLSLEPGDTRLRFGLPVTAPTTTWSNLAGSIRVEDLIALGDSLVTPRFRSTRSLATVDELHREVDRGHGRRGQHARAVAIETISPGPVSRPESLVRLLCARVGIPEPEINMGPSGQKPDLRWLRYRVCFEYLGDGHRGVAQFRYDVGRNERFLDDEWLVMKATADDLFDRPLELVARLARRLRSRGWEGAIDLTQVGRFLR